MTNSYFNHSTPLVRHTRGRATNVNDIFSAVASGFDLLPAPTVLRYGSATYLADSGAANAYVVTFATAPASYTAGLTVMMRAANANTTASTINVNGLGVKDIKRYNGNALSANDIVAGMIVHLVYDATSGYFRMVGIHGASETNAAASATAAASSASDASTSETNASDSATAAAASASAAATSEINALGHYNTFRGVFYGAQASDPTTDPLGNARNAGDFYYNTTSGVVRFWSGVAWQDLANVGTLLAANNLSDLLSAATARSNLGLTPAGATPDTRKGSLDAADWFPLADSQDSDDIKRLLWSTIETQFKDWFSASVVGSGFAVSVTSPAICAISPTRVAVIDTLSDQLRAYDWNGSTWALVGSGLTISGISSITITALSSTRIALFDVGNLELRAYDFDGSTWSLVGSGLSIAGAAASIPSITALNSTDVAFIDSAQDSLRTYRFSGSAWSLVGSGLAISSVSNVSITAMTSTRIALIDTTNEQLRAYDWDGSNWSLVGSGLSITGITSPSLAAMNGTDVAFIDSTNDTLRIYRFDGSAWTQTGHSLSVTAFAGAAAMACLNGTDLAFLDATNDELRTYRWTKKLGRHGSYTGTLTGIDATVTVTINYSIVGDVVTLTTQGSITGTSNANTFTVTGAPTIIRPNSLAGHGCCLLINNGSASLCVVRMGTSGTLEFLLIDPTTNVASSAGFTASGTKGFTAGPTTYTYKLTNP